MDAMQQDDTLAMPPFAAREQAWLVLMVGGNGAAHDAVKAALDEVCHAGRSVKVAAAQSAEQARRLLSAMPGVAVCLIDLHLEDGRSALELVRHIRDDIGNSAARILLCGGPGVVPNVALLDQLDIDGVHPALSSSMEMMKAAVLAALRAHDRMLELDAARVNLTRLNHELETRVRERIRDHTANRERVESILDAVLFPILISRQGDLLVRYANRRVGELFGQPVEDVQEARMADFFDDPRERERVMRMLDHLGRFDDEEIRLRRADGTTFWALMSGVVMQYAGQSCILATFNDISERKAMEIELQRLATTDELTGAATRRYFLDLAGQELRRARRFSHPLAVLVFDIDHFKPVNDRFGHAAGDTVLRAVSESVRRVLREVDTFGRIGGEEFAVVLPETEAANAIQAAERLRRAVGGTAHGVEGLGAVTVSVGVAELIDGDQGLQDLMDRADHALYRAKRLGRNRVESSEG
ncbi:MAG: sensor domain-containing diguanylate cyclase [Rhodospirillaceae bacterium]